MTSGPPTTADASPPPSGTPPGTEGSPLDLVRVSGVIAVALLLVVTMALLDLVTGPYLAFTVFYLIPVAGCAWWSGFTPSLLVAAAASVAGHVVEEMESHDIPVAARIWNDVVRFGTLTLVGSLVSRVRLGMLRERRLARTDPLTGAANARTFYESASQEAERSRRSEQPLTLVYFDLDDFKQLNDQHGHAAGDEALRQVVLTVRSHLRSTDLLARLGGDEFAIVLPSSGADAATTVLPRIQQAVAQQLAARGWKATISIGAVTFLSPPSEVDLMVRRVDALMYGAKRGGKARIEHAVIRTEQEARVTDWPTMERRATVRVVCNRAARVSPEGEQLREGDAATLRDISLAGVGLHLDRRLAVDTVIIIEALSPNVRSLLARVVRTEQDGSGWMHGCVLATSLPETDYGGWVDPGEPAIQPS